MNVLLIGGAGFIGVRTAFKLLFAGHSPVVFDSFDPQIHGADTAATVAELRKHFSVLEGDTRDGEALERCVREAEAIYYFPACTGTGQSMYRAGNYCDVNVRGAGVFADALLRCGGGVARVVVSSSRAVYGEGAARCAEHGRVFPRGRPAAGMEFGNFETTCPHCGEPVSPLPSLEGDAFAPVSIYGITKLAQEMVVANAACGAGITSIVFRYQNVYGPGQSLKNPYTGILSIFTQLLLGVQQINVFEDGLATRDFVHIDDVVEYNYRALTSPLSGPVALNVGTGVRKTIFDLIQALGDGLGVEPSHFVSGDFRLGDIRHAVADTRALAQTLGPLEFRTLESGVQTFTEWVASQHLSGVANASFQKSLDEMRNAGMLRTARET